MLIRMKLKSTPRNTKMPALNKSKLRVSGIQ